MMTFCYQAALPLLLSQQESLLSYRRSTGRMRERGLLMDCPLDASPAFRLREARHAPS